MSEPKEAPQPQAEQKPQQTQLQPAQPQPTEQIPQDNSQNKKIFKWLQSLYYHDLPRLRFWCNLFFYFAFLISFIIGGCNLVKNTKPSGHQSLDKTIENFKNSIKQTDNTSNSDSDFSAMTKQKDNTSNFDSEFSAMTNSSWEITEEYSNLNIDDYIIQINDVDNIVKTTTIQHNIVQQPDIITSFDNYVLDGSVKLFLEDTIEKIVESHIKRKNSECYIIKKDDLDNALKSVAMASRQEVADDYHKNFSILVTILTIFGIAFPIIIALIQHNFNERQLEKLDETEKIVNETQKQVKDVLSKAKTTSEHAESAKEQADEALKQVKKTATQAENIKIQAEKISKQMSDVAIENKQNLCNINALFEQNKQLNFELNNDLVLINNGLYKLYKSQDFDDKIIWECLFWGKSYIHFIQGNIYNRRYKQYIKLIINFLDRYINYFNQEFIQKLNNKEKIFTYKNIQTQLKLLIFNIDNIIADLNNENSNQEMDIENINKFIKYKEKIEIINNKYFDEQKEIN